MQRVPPTGTNPSVLCQEGFVVIFQQVAQALPRKDIETVIPVVLNLHEGDNESAHRAGLRVSDNLPFAVKRDVAILGDVTKLPRRAATCFHLDGDVPSAFVGRDDVVMGDVSGERGRD